ncbi:MAG: hypothetical protein OSA89_16905 [Mariniblastus sp.]|nr:hypothetical protein [Mariniblastus sp.]
MHTRIVGLLALLLAIGTLASAAVANQKGEEKPKAEDAAAAKVADEALRQKVAGNIESIVGGLDVSNAQKAKVQALTSESQWKLAVAAFKATRGKEVHDHAHKIVPKTIPGLMRKFMPAYMRSKIMASRKKGRRGPPSRAEIAKIQKDARTKIQPQMRKTIMPALDKLKQQRITELHQDEKTMTRVLADRIIKVSALGQDGTKQFAAALDKAGYPATLDLRL